MVLDVSGPVANRYAMLLVCNAGEKYFAPTLVDDVGDYGSGCVQVCGVDGCDSGE